METRSAKRRKVASAAERTPDGSWSPISLLLIGPLRRLVLFFLGVEKVEAEELLPNLIVFGYLSCVQRMFGFGLHKVRDKLDYLSDKEVYIFALFVHSLALLLPELLGICCVSGALPSDVCKILRAWFCLFQVCYRAMCEINLQLRKPRLNAMHKMLSNLREILEEIRMRVYPLATSSVVCSGGRIGRDSLDVGFLCRYIEKDVGIIGRGCLSPYIPGYVLETPAITETSLRADPSLLGGIFKGFSNVKGYAMIAVQADGNAIRFVSGALLDIWTSSRYDSSAGRDEKKVPKSFHVDLDLVKAAIVAGVDFWHLPLAVMEANDSLMIFYCTHNPLRFSTIANHLQTAENALVSMRKHPKLAAKIFYNLSRPLQFNKEIAILAVSCGEYEGGYPPKFHAYERTPVPLKYDRDVIKAAILSDSDIMFSNKWMPRWMCLMWNNSQAFIDEITTRIALQMPENLILLPPVLTDIVRAPILRKSYGNCTRKDFRILRILKVARNKRSVSNNPSSSVNWYKNYRYWPRGTYDGFPVSHYPQSQA